MAERPQRPQIQQMQGQRPMQTNPSRPLTSDVRPSPFLNQTHMGRPMNNMPINRPPYSGGQRPSGAPLSAHQPQFRPANAPYPRPPDSANALQNNHPNVLINSMANMGIHQAHAGYNQPPIRNPNQGYNPNLAGQNGFNLQQQPQKFEAPSRPVSNQMANDGSNQFDIPQQRPPPFQPGNNFQPAGLQQPVFQQTPSRLQPPIGYQQPLNQPPNGFQQPLNQPPVGYQQPGNQPPNGFQQPLNQPPAGYQQPGNQPPAGFQQPLNQPPVGYQQPGNQPPAGFQQPLNQPPVGYQHPINQPPSGFQQSMNQPSLVPAFGVPKGMGNPNEMRPFETAPFERAQSKSKIDPNQIPSPVTVQELDQQQSLSTIFGSLSKSMPPLASSDYVAVDEGNSVPRFIRMTAYSLPCSDDLIKTSAIPLGMVIQPYADIPPNEAPVPIVDFGETGPLRCDRCKAYINPFCSFVSGGNKFICNLCGFENHVPSEYFCNLDMSGRRMDLDTRPELRFGTIDFVASKAYTARPAVPMSYIFAIDVSFNALQNGMLQSCVDGLKYLLFGGSKTLPPTAKIGIMTFDRCLHFYNLKSTLDQPQLLVVPDIDDVFVPLSDGFLANPMESRVVIEKLLDSLYSLYQHSRISVSVLGSVYVAAHAALKDTGGKLVIFQTTQPQLGPGALKPREESRILGTDKEKQLFEPAEFFWRKTGNEFSQAGICVDTFLFQNTYIDVASIGNISSLTGGNIYMYSNFNQPRDGPKFINDLYRGMTRSIAFDALLRVRCSNGLKITDHYGDFFMRNATDVELAGIDSESALAVAFKLDGKLDEKLDSFFQVALLYTSAIGQRRIRVINLSVSNTSALSTLYRYADMDTTLNFLAKQLVFQTTELPLKALRDQISIRCVKILSGYRKHCASSTSPGQLILPESYKLFPVYTLSLLKSKGFCPGLNISSDERNYHFKLLLHMSLSSSIFYFYPRMINVHLMDGEEGMRNVTGKVNLPPKIRPSSEKLDGNGIYIIENGLSMMMWIGNQIEPEKLVQLFGVGSLDQVNVNMRSLPVLSNSFSERVNNIIQQMQGERARYCQLQIVRQKMDPSLETEFASMLVEDKHIDSMNYVDYLCSVHRNIQMQIANS